MFEFREGQHVKFIMREYGHNPGEGVGDFYTKTRVQGSGVINAVHKDGETVILSVETGRGHEITLTVKGAGDKTTYVQPLD